MATVTFLLFSVPNVRGQDTDLNNDSFNENNTKVYSTNESPKSEGINITVRYPSNWASKPGSTENSVRTFTKKHSNALTVFVIVIRNLKGNRNLKSKVEVKKHLESMNFERMVAPKSSLISGKYTTIDSFPFAFTRSFTRKTSTDSNAIFFGDSYMTAFRRKVITLQFYTFAAPRVGKEELIKVHKKLSKTYKNVAHKIDIDNTF
ncbi:MAG: hypothetical protein ABEJ72_08225 [Candidatus Aenigmatarchaeota archaeon]